ncbi:MAG: hypothetical protein FJ403_22650 [Verrucomicrobia bacterium]|nr:hypothetical protein [Verrucomicrobiota bacterium]
MARRRWQGNSLAGARQRQGRDKAEYFDLKLKRAFIVRPGSKSYPLNKWAEAVAIRDLKARVQNLA